MTGRMSCDGRSRSWNTAWRAFSVLAVVRYLAGLQIRPYSGSSIRLLQAYAVPLFNNMLGVATSNSNRYTLSFP